MYNGKKQEKRGLNLWLMSSSPLLVKNQHRHNGWHGVARGANHLHITGYSLDIYKNWPHDRKDYNNIDIGDLGVMLAHL